MAAVVAFTDIMRPVTELVHRFPEPLQKPTESPEKAPNTWFDIRLRWGAKKIEALQRCEAFFCLKYSILYFIKHQGSAILSKNKIQATMKNFYWSNIFNKSRDECELIAEFWQKTPLFKDIPFRHIHALTENMHIRNFQPDEVVFRQGDQGAGAILVLDGQVKVYAKHTLLSELNRGDFFGEITLAETEKRTADASCVKKSRLVYFLKQDLEEWIDIEPRLGTIFLMNLASILALRLHQANKMLSEKE